MFIITQDGKRIINAQGFSVERSIGSHREGKYAIIAQSLLNDLAVPVVSYWPDEESAKEELQRIWAALQRGDACYQTKKQL